jgi:GT2 family glycosyltransferase
MSSVTIAIPTFNRGAILVKTIERLLALDPPAAEIVIVDQTPWYPPEIERQLTNWSSGGAIRWIRLQKPSIPGAMNHALRIATQPIVLYVDDDVIPSPHLVAEHEAAYAAGTLAIAPHVIPSVSERPGRAGGAINNVPAAISRARHDSAGAIWAVVGQVLQPGEEVEHFDDARLHRGALRDLEFPFNHDAATDVENVIACNLSVDRERALSIGGFDERYVFAAYRFETDFARRVIAAGGRIRFEPRAHVRHLKIPTGGVRAHGDPRRTAAPTHAVGDYLFALEHVPHFWRYAARRFRQNVFTRYTLVHPAALPLKALAELRGVALARRLARESSPTAGTSQQRTR